jgi:DNA-binding NtrC family response regulator
MKMKTRILIIDNEPRWVNFVKNDLGGFEIVVVSDMETAIAELEKDQFQLVIASSGYINILEKLSKRFKNKKVVVTTVHPSTQEALDAYRKGAARYITKSFNRKSLINDIKELVPIVENGSISR